MAEWFAKYPNDNGEYEITFKGTYEQAKEIEKVCHEVIDKKLEDYNELVIGELIAGSVHPYHIMAGKTRASVEAKINGENGFLKLFPSARYYPNGDNNTKIPHVKFKDKIILTCGYEKKDSWKILRGIKFGVSAIYDFYSCDTDFYRELAIRTEDVLLDIL